MVQKGGLLKAYGPRQRIRRTATVDTEYRESRAAGGVEGGSGDHDQPARRHDLLVVSQGMAIGGLTLVPDKSAAFERVVHKVA